MVCPLTKRESNSLNRRCCWPPRQIFRWAPGTRILPECQRVLPPAENERLIIGIRKPATTAAQRAVASEVSELLAIGRVADAENTAPPKALSASCSPRRNCSYPS